MDMIIMKNAMKTRHEKKSWNRSHDMNQET